LEAEDPGHPPPSWEEFLATYAAQRPPLARVLVDEMGLNLDDLASPGVRRILEAALAAPPGAGLPLHALGPGDRRLAARLSVHDLPSSVPTPTRWRWSGPWPTASTGSGEWRSGIAPGARSVSSSQPPARRTRSATRMSRPESAICSRRSAVRQADRRSRRGLSRRPGTGRTHGHCYPGGRNGFLTGSGGRSRARGAREA